VAAALTDLYRSLIEAGENRPTIVLDPSVSSYRCLDLPCVVLCSEQPGITFFGIDFRGADLRGLPNVKLVGCTLGATELPPDAELVDCHDWELQTLTH
jgi:hypothetical protein